MSYPGQLYIYWSMEANGTNSLLSLFPHSLRTLFEKTADVCEELEEIRLRAGKPICIKLHHKELFLDARGEAVKALQAARALEAQELQAILRHICHDSLYAYEDELKQGFLTVPGGHRVGLVGQIVLEEDGRIRTMKHVGGMNIRIAHEIKGTADPVLPLLYEGDTLCNTLIISPPGCGKTTLLRDLIRQVSDGTAGHPGRTVGVVDERSEIAGSYLGVPQNDVGIRTDVLDACPKVYGMMLLIRSMAPRVVAIDELGSEEDIMAMRQVSACGCGLLATIHGEGIEGMQEKAYTRSLLREGLFTRYVVLEKKNGIPCVKGVFRKEDVCCVSSEHSVS